MGYCQILEWKHIEYGLIDKMSTNHLQYLWYHSGRACRVIFCDWQCQKVHKYTTCIHFVIKCRFDILSYINQGMICGMFGSKSKLQLICTIDVLFFHFMHYWGAYIHLKSLSNLYSLQNIKCSSILFRLERRDTGL